MLKRSLSSHSNGFFRKELQGNVGLKKREKERGVDWKGRKLKGEGAEKERRENRGSGSFCGK